MHTEDGSNILKDENVKLFKTIQKYLKRYSKSCL